MSTFEAHGPIAAGGRNTYTYPAHNRTTLFRFNNDRGVKYEGW